VDFLFLTLSSLDITKYKPLRTIESPIHHNKLVVSLKIKHPIKPDNKKFDAVEIMVGIKALSSSFEWRPFTKNVHTIAFEMIISARKMAF
jgi:hypothetical protein